MSFDAFLPLYKKMLFAVSVILKTFYNCWPLQKFCILFLWYLITSARIMPYKSSSGMTGANAIPLGNRRTVGQKRSFSSPPRDSNFSDASKMPRNASEAAEAARRAAEAISKSHKLPRGYYLF